MKDQCGKESCGAEECKEECSGACEDGMTQAVLSIANQAWAEVLKDKMKKHYEKSKGAELDAIADLGVKAFEDLIAGRASAKAELKAHLDKINKK